MRVAGIGPRRRSRDASQISHSAPPRRGVPAMRSPGERVLATEAERERPRCSYSGGAWTRALR